MKTIKMNIGKIGIAVLGVLTMASCTEISFGDNFLGEAPEMGSTTDTMFESQTNAERVLTNAYRNVPYGLPYGSATSETRGNNILESLSDLHQSFRNNINDAATSYYYTGLQSADNLAIQRNRYVFGSETDFTGIRYAWIYIENVDRVPNMTDAEKRAKKAEAKTLIALYYFNMMRYVGGVPWISHSLSVDDEMSFPRQTFETTVNNIVALLDEAIAEENFPWKWDAVNDGRMSRAAAMALKFKVLHFAASPLFNSDEKWHPDANEYTWYGNYSIDRWKAAAQAGKEFFDEVTLRGEYGLVQATGTSHDDYRAAYRSAYYDRGTSEMLISLRKGESASTLYSNTILHANQYAYWGPTLNYVDMFPWSDGTEFESDTFNWENPSKAPFFTNGATGATRDPRLYENVAVPGDLFRDGTVGPTYKETVNCHTDSGFLIMKFVMQTAAQRNGLVHWPHTRLAEIMLGYAEALAESNGAPTEEAYKMVENVRARVGLTKHKAHNLSKEEFIEEVLDERARELGFEECRWFDLIRRKREADFRKTLYGLDVSSLGVEINPTVFKFKKIELPTQRSWAKNWNTKWYLFPIPVSEVNKNYGMTQNPGW